MNKPTLAAIIVAGVVLNFPCYAKQAELQSPAALGFSVPAEFSQQESVWLAWPRYEPVAGRSNIPQVVEIIAAITPHEFVDLIVNGKSEETIARQYLNNANVSLDKVRFHYIRHTDFWMRDVGAIFIRNPRGALAAINLRFNAWGMGAVSQSFKSTAYIDNKIARAMGRERGLMVFNSSLTAEGGGLEFNGNGTLIATESVILQKQRNPHLTKLAAERELKRLFGVRKIIWLKQGIAADDSTFYGPLKTQSGEVLTALATNGHTDEFVRWVSDDTVLLAEVTKEEAEQAGEGSIAAITRKRLEEAYLVLKNATNQDGKQLKIIRVPVAEEIYKTLHAGDSTFDGVSDMVRADAGHEGEPVIAKQQREATFVAATSYLNYLVTNKVVLIAQYWQPGRSEAMRMKDARAREIIQAAFPDREVVAINNMEDINIGGGGIHCITQQMPA